MSKSTGKARQCAVRHCKRPAGGRMGLCRPCRLAWDRFVKKHGPELPKGAAAVFLARRNRQAKTRARGGSCSVPGCRAKALARGLCQLHVNRFYARGTTADPKPRGGRPCKVPGCNRARHGHGYCELHHRRWRTHGDPLVRSAKEAAQARQAPSSVTPPSP